MRNTDFKTSGVETIPKSSWVKTDTCFENIVSVERKKAILTFHIFSSWIGSQHNFEGNFLDQRFSYLKLVSVKSGDETRWCSSHSLVTSLFFVRIGLLLLFFYLPLLLFLPWVFVILSYNIWFINIFILKLLLLYIYYMWP